MTNASCHSNNSWRRESTYASKTKVHIKCPTKPLRETIGNFQNEINQTVLAVVPQNVEDRQRLLNYVNSRLRKMAESMDIVVTVIGLTPEEKD